MPDRAPRRALPLYFVKLDLRACFDTINQEKLLPLIRTLLSEDDYVIRRFCVLHPALHRVCKAFRRRATTLAGLTQSVEFAREFCTALIDTIFVDQVLASFWKAPSPSPG